MAQSEAEAVALGAEQEFGEPQAEYVEDVEADDVQEEAEEEQGESSDSEDDLREYGIYACLPVEPGEPDWESGEPQTVEEYLRRVRYEARQLPGVVAAAHNQHTAADAPHRQQQQQQQAVGQREHYSSRYLAADPGVLPCHPQLKPSTAWTRDFLTQFAKLRRRLQREYELTSVQAAGSSGSSGGVGYGLVRLPASADAALAEELAAVQLDPPSALMPELQQLQGQDQLAVRRQLHAAIRAAVREEAVSAEVAAQLYALSARIEKPLHAGTCALYRDLLRRCAAQRAALGAAACDPRLPHLNILIALAGAYFGQDQELATMWDDEEE